MPTIFTFPYDPTGQAPSNLIIDEAVILTANQTNRSFTPQYAPFYYDSVVVREAGTLRVLVKDVEYRGYDLASMPTERSGKEVFKTLVVTNKAVSQNLKITYQTVGAEYVQDYSSIQGLVDNLINDSRPLGWPSVLGKPLEYDPSMHLHTLGDVVGFEFVVNALESVKNAILMGDQKQSDAILQYIDQRITDLIALINLNANDLGSQAMLTAQTAKNNSIDLSTVSSNQLRDITTLTRTLRDLDIRIKRYEDLAALAESSINTYLSSYPVALSVGSSPTLNHPLPITVTSPVVYVASDADITLSDDYYTLDLLGVAHVAKEYIALDYYQDSALKVKLSKVKEAATGFLRLDLSLQVPDTRAADLTGNYSKGMDVKIYPLIFGGGEGGLFPVNAWYANFNIVNRRIDTQVDTPLYRVEGDLTNTPITSDSWSSIVNSMQKYLIDTRADYNVAGYGSSTSRKAVTLHIPIGTEIQISFKLSADTLTNVEKPIIMNFSHSGSIYAASIQDSILTEQLLYANPRAGYVCTVGTR